MQKKYHKYYKNPTKIVSYILHNIITLPAVQYNTTPAFVAIISFLSNGDTILKKSLKLPSRMANLKILISIKNAADAHGLNTDDMIIKQFI